MSNVTYWWLAVNGPSVSASPSALPRTPQVWPRPEQLLGFSTQTQQLEVQKFLLTAPLVLVQKFLAEDLPKKVDAGEVLYVRPNNSEPPEKATVWEW